MAVLPLGDIEEFGRLSDIVTKENQPLAIAIDRAECIGSGQCVAVAPRAFRLDLAMKAEVIDPEAEPLDNVMEAAELCPARAIYISRGRLSLFP